MARSLEARVFALLAALTLAGCGGAPSLPIFPTPGPSQPPPPAAADGGLIVLVAILALALAVVAMSRREG
ncbi:MAG: hypothetical protein ACRDHY_16695 [Anaerolineales bacterium]